MRVGNEKVRMPNHDAQTVTMERFDGDPPPYFLVGNRPIHPRTRVDKNKKKGGTVRRGRGCRATQLRRDRGESGLRYAATEGSAAAPSKANRLNVSVRVHDSAEKGGEWCTMTTSRNGSPRDRQRWRTAKKN